MVCLGWPAAADDALPELGPAPAFSLMSQDRRPVSLIDLRGKVVAVTFLYTACPDICPILTQRMITMQDALGAEFGSKIVFVAITLDPEHDNPEVLKDYARTFEANLAGWYFLTGPVAVVRDVIKRYGVFAAKNVNGFIDHNLVTSIVDARGTLRVQYLGMHFDVGEFLRDLMQLVGNP